MTDTEIAPKNGSMKATTLISLTVGSLLALCTACHPSQSAKEYVVEGVVRDSSANGKTIYKDRLTPPSSAALT